MSSATWQSSSRARALAAPSVLSVSRPHAASRGRGAWRRPAAGSGDGANGSSGKVLWFQKNKELWRELETEGDYAAAQQDLAPGQLLFVDYYAGWCAVCKAAYPALCRIVSDPELRGKHFLFAKASLDSADVKARIKREKISGIPWISIYNGGGAKVAGFGASFKRMECIRHNLKFMADRPGEIHLMQVDPNGFLIVPGGADSTSSSSSGGGGLVAAGATAGSSSGGGTLGSTGLSSDNE